MSLGYGYAPRDQAFLLRIRGLFPGSDPRGWLASLQDACFGSWTGGVAALNHRLQAGMPPASNGRCGRCAWVLGGASAVKRLSPWIRFALPGHALHGGHWI